ncbi:MAG: alpha/beta fold hydrolase [Pseudomonadota bacterium]|nr:alpha/beta fold hydrolase [Pseudomonadota bacterium]
MHEDEPSDASTLDSSAPGVTTPDAETPDARTRGATTPGATAPGATAHDATTPGATTPGATAHAPREELPPESTFPEPPYLSSPLDTPPPGEPRGRHEPRSFALRVGVGLAVVAALTAAGLISYALRGRRRERRPLREWAIAAERTRSRIVDGIMMRWEEHGTEGPAVILVHGIPTNTRVWRHVVPFLSGERVYAWELVGYGRSIRSGLGRDISVAAQARYLHDWMRSQGIERAVLVGHGLGGGVVQRLAVAHPNACAGLVLVDSVAFEAWPVSTVRMARSFRRVLPLLPNVVIRRVFDAALDSSTDSSQLYWAPYRATRAGVALANQLGSLYAEDTRATSRALADLTVPARVVWGGYDPMGVETGRRLADVLRAPLDLIEEAGDDTPVENPDVVAAAIEHVVRAATEAVPIPPVKVREPEPA